MNPLGKRTDGRVYLFKKEFFLVVAGGTRIIKKCQKIYTELGFNAVLISRL